MTEKTHNSIFPPVKITQHGCLYFDRIPGTFRLAKITDFTNNGKRKLGMCFLVQWNDPQDVFQICKVSETLKSAMIQPFIDAERVYVSDDVIINHDLSIVI